MHWTYERKGRLIQSSIGSATIPLQFQNLRTNLYSAIIDLNTSNDLQKGDGIIIWFDGYDASGRELSGVGSSDVEPIQSIIRWIAYEPELGNIIATPYRPMVGDIVSIDCTVSNIGLLDGESSMTLFDGDGKVIERLNFTLLVDMQFTHTFEVEAWTDGDLGLQIQIDGQSVMRSTRIAQMTRPEDLGRHGMRMSTGHQVATVKIQRFQRHAAFEEFKDHPRRGSIQGSVGEVQG